MINGNTGDFIDSLYYGTDLWFYFNGDKYLLQGWCKNDLYTIELTNISNLSIPVWHYSSLDRLECVDAFIQGQFFAGKSFYQVEGQIEWVDS